MKVRYTTVESWAQQIIDDLGASSRMLIYSGAAPSWADDAATGILLADIPLEAIPFTGPADTGGGSTITLDITPTPEDSSADATGTAGYARLVTGAGTPIVQFDTITTTGLGGEVEMNTLTITAGVAVQITGAGTITCPESD
jgi:hypothetical protein